jgi:flagellar biosynthesis protein
VALDYDPANGQLPHVVAAGRGYVAEQILALAFANGVKVRQDADLVQILSAIDLDSDIPPEAFAAVAEILAYLYKANQSAPSWFDELYGSSTGPKDPSPPEQA